MHVSRIITYPPFNAAHLEDRHIVAHALNVERHVPNRTEIMVPTCSYRMGVAKMGYGWAVFGMFIQNSRAHVYGRNQSTGKSAETSFRNIDRPQFGSLLF